MKRPIPFIIALLSGVTLFSQTSLHNIRFNHLTTDQGLPHSTVWQISQDKAGFIWIGTYGGLCRYDGYTFKTYKHDPQDSTSISDNSVFAMEIDDEGNIWCGNRRQGISVLDPASGKFRRYKFKKDNKDCINHNDIRTIKKDHNGNIWIGTPRGLNKYDKKTGKFIQYNSDTINKFPGNIFELYFDSKNNLWVGGFHPLYRFDINTMKYKCYSIQGIMNMCEDKNGMIWAGAHYNGLFKIDPSNDSTKHYLKDPSGESTLSDNDFWRGQIFVDSRNNVWLGTEQGGLTVYDQRKNRFHKFIHDPGNIYSISNNFIRSIYEERSGLVFVGTEKGINIYDPKTAAFSVIQHDKDNHNSMVGDKVVSIYEDSKGLIWFTTQGEGISSLDRINNKFMNYTYDPSKKNSFTSSQFIGITEDRNKNIWAFTFGGGCGHVLDTKSNSFKQKGTYMEGNVLTNDREGNIWWGSNGQGLSKYNMETGVSLLYPSDKKDSTTLSSGEITALYEGRGNSMWVGTGSGLNALDMVTGKCRQYKNIQGKENSLSNNLINSIAEDRNGIIWAGTLAGLNSLDVKTGEVSRYFSKHGLPHDHIASIVVDDKNTLWIGTPKGLSHFDPQKNTFINYDVTDGLPSNEFINGSALKSKDNKLYFGTTNGVVSFYPGELHKNSNKPKVILSGLTVLNKTRDLSKDIAYANEITLNYQQYFFTVEFAALDFTAPAKNAYAYKLEGFNEDWVQNGNKRDVTFTNLNAGEYVLKVKAANNHGVWGDEINLLRITITPPWWKTKTFYSACLLLLIMLIYVYIKWRERKLLKEKKLLQEKVILATDEIRKQKELIEEKNKEITDSMHYAKRIQKALMINETSFSKVLSRLKDKN